MSKYITAKYYTENEFAKDPYQATEHSTNMMSLLLKLKVFYQKQLTLFR